MLPWKRHLTLSFTFVKGLILITMADSRQDQGPTGAAKSSESAAKAKDIIVDVSQVMK